MSRENKTSCEEKTYNRPKKIKKKNPEVLDYQCFWQCMQQILTFSIPNRFHEDRLFFFPGCLNPCVSTVFPTVRSTLGPRRTQTTANITKSKKASNTKTTRRTRSSRRIAQKSHPEETLNGRSVSEELLHMIDTMPFQPVSKGGEFTSVSYTCTSFNFYIVWEGEVKLV